MNDTPQTGLNPFHESIVGLINDIGKDKEQRPGAVFYDEFRHRLRAYGRLLLVTKIPKGHDEILVAWQAQCQTCGLNDDMGVIESLKAQKKTAEEAEAKKKLEAYAVGKKPPGLTDDGTFDTPMGVRASSIVAANGDLLVVDKETELLIQDIADEDD